MNASLRMVGIAPAAATGRWLRNPGRVARAEWFGAKGDGDKPAPTNDLPAIDKCLANCVVDRVNVVNYTAAEGE